MRHFSLGATLHQESWSILKGCTEPSRHSGSTGSPKATVCPGCKLQQGAKLSADQGQAVQGVSIQTCSGCCKRTEGIMSFPVQRQPLSAERLRCSFKSSQERSVLYSGPAPRSSRSLSQGVPCASGGAEPPAAVPMPHGAAKSAHIHKGPTCSRVQPLHVAVILSKFTLEPCGLCRLPLSPLHGAVQTNPSSLHSRQGIYK